MGVLVIRKTSIFAQYSKAATVQSFSDLAAGWGLPPARTRRVSSIGAALAPLSAPVNRLGASRHVKCVAAAKQRCARRDARQVDPQDFEPFHSRVAAIAQVTQKA